MLKQRTYVAKAADQRPEWFVVDADGKTLGRLASQVASVLRGKHRPDFTPHIDPLAHVIVVNAKKIRLTGTKIDHKIYRHHSGYPGGLKERTAGQLLQTHPDRLIRRAVWGMLPHNRLGRQLMRKLRVYAGEDHPHTAQKPALLSVEA